MIPDLLYTSKEFIYKYTAYLQEENRQSPKDQALPAILIIN